VEDIGIEMTQWEENNKEIDELRIEKQTKNYGLYAIRLADDSIENRKIYIGRSKNVIKRWRGELWASFNKTHRSYNNALCCFIRSCGNNIKEVKSLLEFVLIAEFDTLEEVLQAEMYYILKFKTNICRFGKLYGYNLTDGGEGNNGHIPSEEQRKKQSIALKKFNDENDRTPEHCENLSKALTGVKKTQSALTIAHQAKFIENNKGVPLTDEHKTKISESNKDKKLTDEQRARISKAQKGIRKGPASALARANMSKAQKGRIFTEEHKQKISLAHTGKTLSDEHKKNLSLAHQKKPYSEKVTKSKISFEIAKNIRFDFFNEKLPIKILADRFNVSRPQIIRIINNETWIDENYTPDFEKIEKIYQSNRPRNKLTEIIVKSIRNEFIAGKLSFVDLAKKYNSSNSMIREIVYNTKWKDKNYEPNIDLIKNIIKNHRDK
jgi:hypothetical protein